MRILIVGDMGFIGSAIHAWLSTEGISVSLSPTGLRGPRHLAADLAQTAAPANGRPILKGIDTVFNAAGAGYA
ncbi:hypothetical protein ACFIOY_36985 [Bradyrhizobium sp. TZ2]|jgi:nucleoside-diphosphate-sugar epimerase